MYPYASNEVIEEAFQRVAEKIKMEGALVVVDDADRDSRECLGRLRRLFDNGGLGLILMGSRALLKRLDEGRGEFGQLAARISGAVNLSAAEGRILWNKNETLAA
jgi:DNA transposition AAA+ family ATPase